MSAEEKPAARIAERTAARTAGVACALAVARAASLSGHALVWTWWSPVAYLWQDAAVVLAFMAIDRALRRWHAVAWEAYAVAIVYIAIGVPVVRVMSTPMTWTMWRAAGGALSDSVSLYVTMPNLSWVAVALGASTLARVVAQGFSPAIATIFRPAGLKSCATAVLWCVAALGPSSVIHVDTRGLDRNAWSALVVSLLPRVRAFDDVRP